MEGRNDVDAGPSPREQRKILREVALTYRREGRAGKHQNEAVDAAIAEYRRLSPFAPGRQARGIRRGQPDDRSGDKRQSQRFWHGPDA
jgi:hypothetical protein